MPWDVDPFDKYEEGPPTPSEQDDRDECAVMLRHHRHELAKWQRQALLLQAVKRADRKASRP